MTEARDALAVALGTALVGEPATEPDAVEFLTQRADAILAALPDGLVLARRQDAEDGAALRRLREALPDSEDSSIVMQVFKDGSLSLQVWNGFGWRNASEPEFTENTLAAAADKAREAIGADR